MPADDPQWGGAREGAGRKPVFPESGAPRSLHFQLPDRLIAKLTRLAIKAGMNTNRYLAKLIEDAK